MHARNCGAKSGTKLEHCQEFLAQLNFAIIAPNRRLAIVFNRSKEME